MDSRTRTNVLKTFIGIDPGWKNLGFAVSYLNTHTGKVHKSFTCTYNPSSFSNINEFITHLDCDLELTENLVSVTIERYVAYEGIHTSEAENINLVIGALIHYFGGTNSKWAIEPVLVRAVDWKMKLVKALFKKKGFNNPSSSLDKKFSIAAAKAVIDYEDGKVEELATDHEADALCLSTLPIYIGTSK